MAAVRAVDWREGLDAGDLSSVALVRDSFHRIRTMDDRLHAILAMDEERSLRLAQKAHPRR